jgi:hypothetical protein
MNALVKFAAHLPASDTGCRNCSGALRSHRANPGTTPGHGRPSHPTTLASSESGGSGVEKKALVSPLAMLIRLGSDGGVMEMPIDWRVE